MARLLMFIMHVDLGRLCDLRFPRVVEISNEGCLPFVS